MKKILTVLVIFTLVSGCAGFGKFSSGVQTVVDMVCSPTPAQQATAALMLAALDAGQTIGAAFFPIVGIAKASAVLTTIKNGSCFLISELTEAFKAVDAANVVVAQKQMKMLKGAPVMLPEYAPLRQYVK